MKYGKNRMISLLSAMTLLGSAMFGGTAFSEDTGTADPGSGLLSAAVAAAIPEYQWQKTAAFPDWKGYTDDTLAMNSMLSFQFWHGQGTLWLSVSEEVESFTLYVNGVPCDTSGMTAGAWTVDISGVSADGTNTVQVSNILPLGLKDAVTVYIPYPVVTEAQGSLEGIRPETLQLISDIIETDTGYGFSGAQLAVVKKGRLVYENAWGTINRYEPDGRIKEDSAEFDMYVDNAMALCRSFETLDHVYYFSLPCQFVTQNPDGTYSPREKEMEPLFRAASRRIGRYTGVTPNGYVIDESWQMNDGLVNTKSALAPLNAPKKELDRSNIEPGVWQVLPTIEGDHMYLMGGLLKNHPVRDIYLDLLGLVYAKD